MAKKLVSVAVPLALAALRLCAGQSSSGPKMLGATLDVYPGSSCVDTPSGIVSVSFEDLDENRRLGSSKMSFHFLLTGLPASETGGIHIHEGTTCDDADLVGGHYWTPDSDADPWTNITWKSDSGGKSTSGTQQLETGYDYDENLGHAVVWHNQDGIRCGCGLLTAMKPTLTAKIEAYPAYTGDVKPKGIVSVTMMEDNVHMLYGLDLKNLETSTAGGVHIHSGTTCASADDVGGHWWTPVTDTDIWTAVQWASDAKGKSTSSPTLLATGYDWQYNVGHAVVVHSANGTRVGCGILEAKYALQKPALTATIETYPDYTGDVEPNGTVTVQMMADDMHMEYAIDLQNLEASTSGGVHIHSGTTCKTADDVGGHWWTPETDTDVWTSVTWESDENGKSTSSSKILATGYDYEGNTGHAVVVHAADGTRVGCGILKFPKPRLYSLMQALQGSASTLQLAGLASVSATAIFAVVALRWKKAREFKPIAAGEDSTTQEIGDSEEAELIIF